jgi:predicted DNA-binding antitoxin AbrB/MazE fold protein
MNKKKRKMQATVEKVIKPTFPGDEEKVEISIDEGETFYKEIRVKNALTDDKGAKSSLKEGAKVDVVIEADMDDTLKQSN